MAQNLVSKINFQWYRNPLKTLGIICFTWVFIAGCSKNNAGLPKQVYHDLTGYYNGLFNAELLLDEKIDATRQNYEVKYNERLSVYPEGPIVPGQMRCEDVIEKAQAMIQKQNREKMDREISHQTDDAWLLVGKAFLYEGNFEAAIDAFRYVTTFYEEGIDARSNKKQRKQNSNSKRRQKEKDEERARFEDLKEGKDIRPKAKLFIHEYARSEALTLMLRAYVESGQYNLAESILTFIRSDLDFLQNLDWEIHRIEADLALRQNDIERAIQSLERSTLEAPKLERKTMEFVLGQLYQETNRNLEANAWFSQCIKRNGNLDMLFYARLNQAKESPNDEADKLLGKLLKENKYNNFFGEIWFARAELAQNAGDLENATLYFQKACQEDGTVEEVLCASYTILGDIFYDQKDYIQASAYYDSASNHANRELAASGALEMRRQNLAQLADYLETIETFTNQQAINALSEEELYALAKEQIEEEDRTLQEAQARQERLNALSASSDGGSGFYFNSVEAMKQGQVLFASIWGDRPLEDNWRRSDKLSFTEVNTAEPLSEEDQFEQRVQERAESLRSASNKSAEDMKIIYEAFYGAGFIFRVNLHELSYAQDKFQQLVVLLTPEETTYRPNTIYNLYLIAQEEGDSAKMLTIQTDFQRDYGQAMYEKMFGKTKDAKADKTDALLQAAQIYYDSLYGRYLMDSLQGLHRAIDISGARFNPNPIQAKFDLLKAMIYAKESNHEFFVNSLTGILKDFKGSEESLYAYELLDQLGLAPEQNSTSLPFPKSNKKESTGLIDERNPDTMSQENSEEDGKVKMTIGNKSFNLGKEENNPEENSSDLNEKE
ncbi:MAG: hypothetical protein CBD74_04840 [Saprospirales bacterium TMED214]|nr:MAG: hypothetical protein CBD74_04840 [Saprospirales bacterium TMED214]